VGSPETAEIAGLSTGHHKKGRKRTAHTREKSDLDGNRLFLQANHLKEVNLLAALEDDETKWRWPKGKTTHAKKQPRESGEIRRREEWGVLAGRRWDTLR